MTARLHVTLTAEPGGVRVEWRLEGVVVDAGEALGQLPLSIAGAPTVELAQDALSARDDDGPIRLEISVKDDEEDEPVRRWRVDRATSGPIEVAYLARPVAEEPRPATPPLELRREGTGLSGALKCFLVLPPGPEDAAFELRWQQAGPDDFTDGRTPVCSLGEGAGESGELSGTGLELLGDTYLLWGDLAQGRHRDGQMSTWWLTPPTLDVESFTARLGRTYALMSTAFGAPAHPYRVFLRTHPHRGANASAHPASFVIAMNPANPVAESGLYETLAHELVHEWLHLDGPAEEISWFVEGSADYYSLVLPRREGMVDEDDFLREINLASRTGYASPRRHLSLREASRVFFSDALAHRLPYVRGMFYLADLEARLRATGTGSVDDLVRDVVRRQRDGVRVAMADWCDLVDQTLPGDERRVLDALVLTGDGRPGPGTFGPEFEMTEVRVPVLDVGFDFSTWVTGRVRGLVAGGLAERAGLVDEDEVTLPRYPEALALDADDALVIEVLRDGQTSTVAIPLDTHTAVVPQWQKRSVTGEETPPASARSAG